MKDLTKRDVFGEPWDEDGEEYSTYPSIGYLELVATMGVDVVKHETIGSYQGDYLLIVKEGGSYGYLEFGYGSCSGCDALQACSSMEDVAALRQRLYESIQWGPSAAALAQWMKDRDWESQWVWHESEAATWIREAAKMLGEVA